MGGKAVICEKEGRGKNGKSVHIRENQRTIHSQ